MAHRVLMLVAGVVVALLVFASIASLGDPGGELFTLSVVAGLVVSSYLIGEAVGVVPAIVEILLGFLAGLAGVEPTGALDLLALMGSVFLMFAAGSEVDLELLGENLGRSLLVGTASFLAPFLAASGACILLGYSVYESLLVGVGVSTTSVAVVYAILRGRGLLRTRSGQIVLASTMAVDVISILAFVALVASPPPVVIAAYAAALVIVPLAAKRLIRLVPVADHEPEIRVLMALLLAVALFSEAAGVHAVLFAFILGAAMREALRNREMLPEKMSGLVFGFLSPVFFTTAGLYAAQAGLTPGLAALSLIILASSLPAKVLATHAALAHLAGIRDPRLSMVFGARLTVSTIIAYTGLVRGALAPELAAAVMLTAIAATTLAGVAAGWRQVEESLELEEDVIVPTD